MSARRDENGTKELGAVRNTCIQLHNASLGQDRNARILLRRHGLHHPLSHPPTRPADSADKRRNERLLVFYTPLRATTGPANPSSETHMRARCDTWDLPRTENSRGLEVCRDAMSTTRWPGAAKARARTVLHSNHRTCPASPSSTLTLAITGFFSINVFSQIGLGV